MTSVPFCDPDCHRNLILGFQAEKALQGAGGGFSMFGGRTEKYENAADLFTQAANAFRVQKQSWSHEASHASTNCLSKS